MAFRLSCTPHAPREASAHGVCRIQRRPVVTGCSPNHLDWHASFGDYVAAKQRILTGQTPDDFAVLNTLDAEVASWLPLVRGRRIPLSRARILACQEADRNVCPTILLADLPVLSVPGEHNRINAACAAAAALATGCQHERRLPRSRGVPRLAATARMHSR